VRAYLNQKLVTRYSGHLLSRLAVFAHNMTKQMRFPNTGRETWKTSIVQLWLSCHFVLLGQVWMSRLFSWLSKCCLLGIYASNIVDAIKWTSTFTPRGFRAQHDQTYTLSYNVKTLMKPLSDHMSLRSLCHDGSIFEDACNVIRIRGLCPVCLAFLIHFLKLQDNTWKHLSEAVPQKGYEVFEVDRWGSVYAWCCPLHLKYCSMDFYHIEGTSEMPFRAIEFTLLWKSGLDQYICEVGFDMDLSPDRKGTLTRPSRMITLEHWFLLRSVPYRQYISEVELTNAPSHFMKRNLKRPFSAIEFTFILWCWLSTDGLPSCGYILLRLTAKTMLIRCLCPVGFSLLGWLAYLWPSYGWHPVYQAELTWKGFRRAVVALSLSNQPFVFAMEKACGLLADSQSLFALTTWESAVAVRLS
jgi:hypothetical protein